MTRAQQARIRGWDASLTQRGVLLLAQPSGKWVKGIVDPIPAESQEYSLSQETRNGAWVCFLRSDVSSLGVVVGGSFSDAAGNTYRVCEVKDDAADILTRFRCEASLIPPSFGAGVVSQVVLPPGGTVQIVSQDGTKTYTITLNNDGTLSQGVL